MIKLLRRTNRMEKNIFEIAEEVLKTNSKYISEDGNLLKALVYSDIMTMDKYLLSLLLSNERMKKWNLLNHQLITREINT